MYGQTHGLAYTRIPDQYIGDSAHKIKENPIHFLCKISETKHEKQREQEKMQEN